MTPQTGQKSSNRRLRRTGPMWSRPFCLNTGILGLRNRSLFPATRLSVKA